MHSLYSCSPCRYQPSSEKGGAQRLLPNVNTNPSSRQAFTLSQPMNSPSPWTRTHLTHSGNNRRNCRICRATSRLFIVSPRRCVPHRYSRVSARKHSTGRSPFLPRCLGLCPLRAPSMAPYTVLTVVSMFTVTRLGRYAHKAHTFPRSAAPSFSSEADCTIDSDRTYRQNVLTAGTTATRNIPQTIAS